MKIVIKRSDGNVAIMALVEAKDMQAEIVKWIEAGGDYVSHRVMPDDAIPTDRTFRNAWCDVTPSLVVDIDMPKARSIHRDNLRLIRAPIMQALDVDFMRALEAGTSTAQITAKKQALRNVTEDPAIEAARTPEQLKAVMPAILKPV